MFEITGAHIADLNDTDLRTLVARLALDVIPGVPRIHAVSSGKA